MCSKERDCLMEVYEYLKVQADKGLVDGPAINWAAPKTPILETHWGLLNEVVLPEIRRIAADYGFHAYIVKLRFQQGDGAWWEYDLTPNPGLFTKNAWVHVVLALDE